MPRVIRNHCSFINMSNRMRIFFFFAGSFWALVPDPGSVEVSLFSTGDISSLEPLWCEMGAFSRSTVCTVVLSFLLSLSILAKGCGKAGGTGQEGVQIYLFMCMDGSRKIIHSACYKNILRNVLSRCTILLWVRTLPSRAVGGRYIEITIGLRGLIGLNF